MSRWTPNLFDMGYERVAENLRSRLKVSKGRFYCFVLPNGKVYLRPTRESRIPMPSDEHLVGTYTRHTLTEWIESDLIQRMRDQSHGNSL